MRKIFTKAIMLMAFAGSMSTANAQVIKHQADRYVINVEEMDLNGEETLLDLLMMIPDVVTVDGNAVISGDANSSVQKRMFGQYAVRVDNMNIQVNAETFVKNTKARDIKYIKVCTNPGIQKGCGGLKQVIDIYYRKHDAGNEGRVAIEADTYGKGGIYATDWKSGDNYSLHTYAIGNLENRKYDDGSKTHASQEQLRAHFSWDITGNDNLIITGAQSFTREKTVGSDPTFERSFFMDAVYTRDLGNGAYALFQGGIDYNHNNTVGTRVLSTNPYALIEFGAPFISNNFYINGGIEAGYSAETDDMIGSKTTYHERYEDIYGQLDWYCGKFNFSIGDRVRFFTKYFSNEFATDIFNHTATENHLTVSSWVNLNDKNTIQGTFARRFYGPNISGMMFKDMSGKWYGYMKDITSSPVYTAELRYTYQKKDFNLMGIVKNVHVNQAYNNFENSLDHDNILQIGATAYVHCGALRLTAGVDYNWQNTTFIAAENYKKYNNFFNFKLVPQLSLAGGLRLTSTLLYNTRKSYAEELKSFYTPANFYAEVGASKEFSEHFLVEAKFHDIVGQHTGNRAATIGCTFSW